MHVADRGVRRPNRRWTRSRKNGLFQIHIARQRSFEKWKAKLILSPNFEVPALYMKPYRGKINKMWKIWKEISGLNLTFLPATVTIHWNSALYCDTSIKRIYWGPQITNVLSILGVETLYNVIQKLIGATVSVSLWPRTNWRLHPLNSNTGLRKPIVLTKCLAE